jgi:hypothetical protein
MSTYHYTLFADYFQFYLQDEEADGDLSDAWTEQAVNDLLAVAPGTIGVGTVRNMDVRVEVEIGVSEPLADIDEWDHVAECNIEVPSGRIVIAGCTDYLREASRIEVQPGSYRARVHYGNLKSLSEDGLDGDDHYRIVLWLSEVQGVRVIKRRSVL